MASKVTLNGELLFPNDYLAAAEFKGKDVTLTIAAISREMLQKKGGKDKKETVLRFNGTTKKLVCNKTNADSIAVLYGTKAEAWVGQKVTLYPTRCLAFGEMVDCIRIREKKPTGKATPPPADIPDDLPPPSMHDEPDAYEHDDPTRPVSPEEFESTLIPNAPRN